MIVDCESEIMSVLLTLSEDFSKFHTILEQQSIHLSINYLMSSVASHNIIEPIYLSSFLYAPQKNSLCITNTTDAIYMSIKYSSDLQTFFFSRFGLSIHILCPCSYYMICLSISLEISVH